MSLQPGGDLGALAWESVLVRGPSSIAIELTAGYATLRMVYGSVVTERNKLGNDKADEYADKGNLKHGSSQVQVMQWLAKRQQEYCSLVKKIHDVIAAVLGEEKEERERCKEIDDLVKGYDGSICYCGGKP